MPYMILLNTKISLQSEKVKLEIKAKDTINFTSKMPAEQRFSLEQISAKESYTITNLINMILKKYISAYNNGEKIRAAKLIATLKLFIIK